MNLVHISKRIAIPLLAACGLFGGCTSVRVKPVTAENRIDHVCIQENSRVQVGDFVAVMQEGFEKHGITSQLVRDPPPANCHFVSTYTARRTWDMAMYMTDAQIDVLRDGRPIASANYHLKGKGGFALNKWAGTRSKILPVMDELLAQIAPVDRALVQSTAPVSSGQQVALRSPGAPPSGELSRKLSDLKDAYDAQMITKGEYEAKRAELIEKL